jgi:RNA polymerase sigma factor (sigma-70 family)
MAMSSGAPSGSAYELLLSASRGDMDSYSELFSRYSEKLYNYAYYLTFSREDAEDITSEAFMRVYDAIQGRDVSSFNLQAYLYKTARNLSFKSIERREREGLTMEEALEVPQPDASADPQTAALIGEQRASVLAVAGSLTEEQQSALLLRELEGLPYDTIAQVLDSNPNAVGALLSRARLRFREVYRMSQAQTQDIPDPCVALLPAFSRYIDNEATPAEVQKLQEHLSSCPICNANLASMQEASVTYRSLVPVLPLATLKVWSATKGAIIAGKAAAAAAHAAGSAAGSAGGAVASAGGGAVAAGGAASAGAGAATAAATVGTATGMAVLTKILIVAATVLVLGGVGTGGYFTLKATVFAKKTVPILTGMNQKDTEAKAQQAGLKVSCTFPDSIQTGNEVGTDQDPKPKTQVDSGTTIKVTMVDKAVADAKAAAQAKIVEANKVLADAQGLKIVTTEYDPAMQSAQAKFSNAKSVADYTGPDGAVPIAQGVIDACNQKKAAWQAAQAAQQAAQERDRQIALIRDTILAQLVNNPDNLKYDVYDIRISDDLTKALATVKAINPPPDKVTDPVTDIMERHGNTWVSIDNGTGYGPSDYPGWPW